MNRPGTYGSRLAIYGIFSVCLTTILYADAPQEGETSPTAKDGKNAATETESEHRVSLEVARDRAKLLHDVYATTLDVMHHRYFHGEKAVVPARALEDVFSEMRRQSKAEARWISVNVRAMSIDHDPETPFEKKAAKELATSKTDIETIEDGYYRRARAIPLTAGCISCHAGFFKGPTKSPKFAGLVISIPIKSESTERE